MSGRLAASTAVATDKPAVERRHAPNALMRLINPFMRRLVGRDRLGSQLLVLHYVGRRSGRISTCQWVTTSSAGWCRCSPTAAGGTTSPAGGTSIVTLRGVRQPAQAALCDDPDEVAHIYQRLIEDVGTDRAARRLGLTDSVWTAHQPAMS